VKIRVLSCAEREFVETVDHYNGERPGLGYEFAEEIQSAFERIRTFPAAWPLFSARARRCVVSRFPYGILYQVRPDCILVVAIMHLKRNPQVWRERANG
jgi:plasmid stabilization system protein ParE